MNKQPRLLDRVRQAIRLKHYSIRTVPPSFPPVGGMKRGA